MAASKVWYVTGCLIHGVPPKNQTFKEVKVAAPKPGSKGLGRHKTKCPICVGESKGVTK